MLIAILTNIQYWLRWTEHDQKGVDMETRQISRHAATNILHAFDYAKKLGRPLNCYVVICCDEQGAGKTASDICRDIRSRYRDWGINAARRYGIDRVPPTYVQTIEDPDGGNAHSNWVLHVPPVLFDEFLKKLPQWVKRAQGAVKPLDIAVQKVDPFTDKTLAKYIVKGVDEYYNEYFHLQAYLKQQDQGVVEGRRTCVSPSIGRAARKEAGFIPKRHRDDWKATYEPPKGYEPKRLYVNTHSAGDLHIEKKPRKASWGGFDLPASEELVEPSCCAPMGL